MFCLENWRREHSRDVAAASWTPTKITVSLPRQKTWHHITLATHISISQLPTPSPVIAIALSLQRMEAPLIAFSSSLR